MLADLKSIGKRILAQGYRRWKETAWETTQFPKVLIETWKGFTEADWLETFNSHFPGWSESCEVRFVHNSLERYLLIPEMQVYVGTWLDAGLLARASRLDWVHLCLVGTEFLEKLTLSPDIKVTSATGVSVRGVAEHVLGLIISLDRRFDLALKRQLFGIWSQKGIVENIRGLRGRTVGIIGLGRNGQAIAELCRKVGMRVIGLDQRRDLVVEDVEVIYSPEQLTRLLQESDFVVISLPLTEKTRAYIGRAELDVMRSNAYLINIARGAIVDERALASALRNHKIAGAAVDVLAVEPPPVFYPLRRCPNLIVTPHVAGNIYIYRDAIRKEFVCDLESYVSGRKMTGQDPHV